MWRMPSEALDRSADRLSMQAATCKGWQVHDLQLLSLNQQNTTPSINVVYPWDVGRGE